jgi:hypothetical protein
MDGREGAWPADDVEFIYFFTAHPGRMFPVKIAL